MIITDSIKVNDEIIQLAEKNGVNLLVSPYDIVTTIELVRQSIPACRVAQDSDGYLLLDEDLDVAREKVVNSNNRSLVVLDEQKKLKGIAATADLLRFTKTKLILVDHNEISQAVDGAGQADIIEIVDHHRLGSLQTLHPIYFLNQPVGSTCTLIAKLYFENNIELDKQTAGLLISGIISDTVNLKSPTATGLDSEMLNRLNAVAGLDLQDYSSQMLGAGISIANLTAEEIILNDFKEYIESKVSFGVGQLELVGLNKFQKVKNEIVIELKKIRENRRYNFISLLVTDVSTSYSLLVFDGEKNLCAKLGYHILEPNIAELKGVLSRKKQLLPHLLSIFK